MGKYAPAALVAVLLIATTAAFAYTERLKLTPSPILGTRVDKQFSPTCECATSVARIAFRLRKRDRVTATVVSADGDVVRTLVTNRPQSRGLVVVFWDGRDDAGRVVAAGSYKPRIKLAVNRRTIVLPNPIRVDTRPPVVELTGIQPRIFSPDGDRRSDRLVVTYRVDEPAHVALYVDGVRRARKRGTRQDGAIDWFGRANGRPVATGVHKLSLVARDVAGNISARTPPHRVVLRYISLGRERIVSRPGKRFALLVSADSKLVEWQLAGRSGLFRPGTVHLRAPKRPGRYTLTLREHGHAVRAAVIVRKAS